MGSDTSACRCPHIKNVGCGIFNAGGSPDGIGCSCVFLPIFSEGGFAKMCKNETGRSIRLCDSRHHIEKEAHLNIVVLGIDPRNKGRKGVKYYQVNPFPPLLKSVKSKDVRLTLGDKPFFVFHLFRTKEEYLVRHWQTRFLPESLDYLVVVFSKDIHNLARLERWW